VYPWGNSAIFCSLANFWPSFSTTGCIGDTTGVGSYPEGRSPYGAYDMAGNVWEWVADWYVKDYYSFSPKNNPRGPSSGGPHILRGGSWYWFEHGSLSTRRVGHGPDVIFYGIGFRCSGLRP
jgi:formylglycine-generating enzyme required for sulfatase activity